MIFKKVAIGIALNSFALFLTVQMLDEIAITGGLKTLIYGGIVLGVLNSVIKPLFKITGSFLHIIGLIVTLVVANTVIFYLLDITLDRFYGLRYDIIIETSLVSYIKVGKLFGTINWLEHLIVK